MSLPQTDRQLSVQDIASIEGPIRVRGEGFGEMNFSNGVDLLRWQADNPNTKIWTIKSDNTRYVGELPELEVTAKGVPTQDILTEGLDQNVQLEEKPTLQRRPYHTPFNDTFYNMSDWDSLFGQTRVNLHKRQSPNFMDNWTLNYNNTFAPIVNMGKFAYDYFFPKPLGVMDLSNASFEQITDPNKYYQHILVNDFVESNLNNIRLAKDFYNTADTLIGDNLIPLSNMPLFAGVENEKFKIDSLHNFNQYTTVVPVRSRNRPGGYVEIIPGSPDSIPEQMYIDHREAIRQARQKYPEIPWYKFPSMKEQDQRYMQYSQARDSIFQQLRENHGNYEIIPGQPVRGITTYGDTITINPGRSNIKALFYSPTTNKTLFTGSLSNDNIQQINKYLRTNPSYIGIFDNGRYYHTTSNSTVQSYKAPFDNLNNMFIVGIK